MSRNLLLLGAPLCFVLQARPVKIGLKQVFYACANPPGILLSLLPAPQQVILNFDIEKAEQALYGVEAKVEEIDEEDDQDELLEGNDEEDEVEDDESDDEEGDDDDDSDED